MTADMTGDMTGDTAEDIPEETAQMAVLSSHFLNGVDGTHAGDVGVELVSVAPDGSRQMVFSGKSDAGGRFIEEIEIDHGDREYEMVVASGAYFAARDLPTPSMQIVNTIIIRFAMPDPTARYHIPIIMSPNSYSCWWSG